MNVYFRAVIIDIISAYKACGKTIGIIQDMAEAKAVPAEDEGASDAVRGVREYLRNNDSFARAEDVLAVGFGGIGEPNILPMMLAGWRMCERMQSNFPGYIREGYNAMIRIAPSGVPSRFIVCVDR